MCTKYFQNTSTHDAFDYGHSNSFVINMHAKYVTLTIEKTHMDGFKSNFQEVFKQLTNLIGEQKREGED